MDIQRDLIGDIFGPMVTVERRRFDGDVIRVRMSALFAAELYRDPANGTYWIGSRIRFKGLLDTWGGSA